MTSYKNCTIDELMIVEISKIVENGDLAFYGASAQIPMSAMMLAKMTHAPKLIYVSGMPGPVEPRPPRISEATMDSIMAWGSNYRLEIDKIFDLAERGYIDIMFFSGAQIDKYGNTNATLLGSFDNVKVKLSGGAAIPDLTCKMPICLWSTRHRKSPKGHYTFVEKCDFITGLGYGDGPDYREKWELKPNTGPFKVVTSLCTFIFDEKTKIMKLEKLMPDVTVEDVIENTQFEPIIPNKNIPIIKAPAEEQIRLIRECIDPTDVRKLEFRQNRDELKRVFEL